MTRRNVATRGSSQGLSQQRWLALMGVVLVLGVMGAVQASTAANSVPTSRLGTMSVAGTIAQLTPPECAGLNLTNLVVGTGDVQGTSAGDLVLAGAGSSEANGGQGHDCVIGGAGTQRIRGGPGNDICIGPVTANYQQCQTIFYR